MTNYNQNKGKGFLYIKLNGGLGNQMFQWAMARTFKEILDVDVFLDMSYFAKRYSRPYQLDIFKVKPDFVKGEITKMKLEIIWAFRKILQGVRVFGIRYYEEQSFNYDSGVHKIGSNSYISGFFQSERYFRSIADKIREDFKFAVYPTENSAKIIAHINRCNAVSLHIRRGDYVAKKRYQDQYAQCSLSYYKRAVDYIAERHPDPTLFIFSDDIEWVKKNLRFPHECVYVEGNNGEKSYEDMRLMSLCSHNIIANSSFSWWGAWLNPNPDKIVVAPTRWFNDPDVIQTDIIPPEWVKLEN